MSKTSVEQIVSREVESFRAVLKSDKKSIGTLRQYTEAVEQMLRHCKKSPEQLTPEDLQSFKGFLSEKYCENAMYCRVVAVNQYTERMLHRLDLKMRPPGMVKVSKIPLTEDEVRAVQKAASDTSMGRRDLALIDVLYYGGLRCAEVSQLTLSCLDLDKNRLRVNAGKGKNYDMVNLAPEAVQSLRDYIDHERQPKDSEEDRLFLNKYGMPLGKTGIWRMTKRIALDAGISKDVHPHIFRHSMITHMAEKGLSASFIQAQSRHKSLDMVARYTHLSEKAVRTAYDSVFTPEKPQGPARLIPAQPISAKAQDVAYAAPKLTHEDVLRARLEGKIDTSTMEAMLAHLEGMTMTPIPKAQRLSLGYA